MKKLATALTLVLCLFVLTIPVAHADPKSLYLIANHHTRQFDTWNINPDGTATYQFKVTLNYAASPADIAIDESSNTLFITSEGTYGGAMVEIVDASTMTLLGMVTGPTTNAAGIEADDANNIVYVMRRSYLGPYRLDAFDWDDSAKTLTPIAGFPKTLTAGGFGIALDETTDILWVADGWGQKARAYSTTTWTEDTTQSWTPSHKPVDIAVDRVRGFVYTVSMTYAASTPSGTGSNLLCKWDGTTETTVNMATALGVGTWNGVGVAVDEVKGYVYVVGGYGTLNAMLTVWDTSTSPFTLKGSYPVSGSPAGICIPQEEVAYNPLGLTKSDTPDPVLPGGSLTYSISYDNTQGTVDVSNVVLVDTLPPETTFVSASDGGTYDSATHTVTWNIGTVTAGSGPFTVTLDVTVNSGTPPGTTITNYATIDSDETPPTTVYEDTTVSGEEPPGVPEFSSGIPVMTSIAALAYLLIRRRKRP